MTRKKKTSSQFLVCRWSKDFVFQQEFKSSGSFHQRRLDFLFWFSQQHQLCNCKSNCVHLSSDVHHSKHFHTGIQTLKTDWHTDMSSVQLTGISNAGCAQRWGQASRESLPVHNGLSHILRAHWSRTSIPAPLSKYTLYQNEPSHFPEFEFFNWETATATSYHKQVLLDWKRETFFKFKHCQGLQLEG